jgi:hypothetical protein
MGVSSAARKAANRHGAPPFCASYEKLLDAAFCYRLVGSGSGAVSPGHRDPLTWTSSCDVTSGVHYEPPWEQKRISHHHVQLCRQQNVASRCTELVATAAKNSCELMES